VEQLFRVYCSVDCRKTDVPPPEGERRLATFIVVHGYKNRNCRFNSNEPQRDTSPRFAAEHAVEMLNRGPQSRPYLSTGLSASIAHYRYQAKYFNGQSDGEIEVTPREAEYEGSD